MQRAFDGAVNLALAAFAKVDEHNVGPADQGGRLLDAERPAALRDGLLRHADLHVGGNGDVHHLRIGELEVVHQRDVFVD